MWIVIYVYISFNNFLKNKVLVRIEVRLVISGIENIILIIKISIFVFYFF